MKVFSPSVRIDGLPNDGALEDLWKRSWAENGWEPVVLPPSDGHSLWGDLAGKFDRIGSVNPPAYRTQCITRWVDFYLAGAGVMADMDLINAGFRPADCPSSGDEIITFTDDLCPCGVSATLWRTRELIDFFERFPGRQDYMDALGNTVSSDQEMFRLGALTGEAPAKGAGLAEHYGNPGWEGFPLVHFGTWPCLKLGGGRSKVEIATEFYEQKRDARCQ